MSYRWLQTSCGAWDVRPSHVVNSMANIVFSRADFGILREDWISRSRCNIWGSVRAQGPQEETSASWFALDQPSINGIGPINRSEKWKRSKTVGNGHFERIADLTSFGLIMFWKITM